MELHEIKQEFAKLCGPTKELSEEEMSKTPLPPDNRKDIAVELAAARRGDAGRPQEAVRCSSEWLADLQRRADTEWAKLCELEEAASNAESAAKRQSAIWQDINRELKPRKVG